MRFRFLHAADLHLDSPFRGLSAAAPARVAADLAAATLGSWDRIVDLALAERVDLVVVAGDIFETEARTIRAQLAFADGARRLDAAGIPTFLVTGNHDPLSGWEASVPLPPSVHRFGADDVEAIPVRRDGETIAHVHGISYAKREVRENLAVRFHKGAGAPFSIGLLHANVGGRPGHEDYAPCSVADLVATGIDYWALGHIHQPTVIRESSPTIVYPGNPQGRDPGETEPRGAVLVTVEDGRVFLDPRALDRVRWAERALPIGPLPSIVALEEALRGLAEEARAEAGRPTILRLRLQGAGPLHTELRRDPGGLAAIRERLNTRLLHGEPWTWVEQLTDRTRSVDAESVAGELVAELDRVIVEAGDAFRAGTPDPAGVRAALAALNGRDGLREALGTFRPEELDAIVLAARERIVDELAGRG